MALKTAFDTQSDRLIFVLAVHQLASVYLSIWTFWQFICGKAICKKAHILVSKWIATNSQYSIRLYSNVHVVHHSRVITQLLILRSCCLLKLLKRLNVGCVRIEQPLCFDNLNQHNHTHFLKGKDIDNYNFRPSKEGLWWFSFTKKCNCCVQPNGS